MHQHADALQFAIEHLTGHLVTDAQSIDPDEWGYISRVFVIGAPTDGVPNVAVSAWIGRHGAQFRAINVEDRDGNLALARAALEDSTEPRTLILRVTRMPQFEADSLEVSVEYSEISFDDEPDASDVNLGGFSLFGEI